MLKELENLENLGGNGSADLQRTAEWHELRKGMFTGSKIKDLMKTSRSTARMEWGRPEKMIDFGDTAKKYIYSRAMELIYNRIIEMPDVLQFKYGRAVEPIAIELLNKKVDVIEQPFIKVPGHEDYLGASPDGLGITTIDNKRLGVEIKGAMNWETFYTRAEVAIDEKHIDFWQLQTEMMALEVDELLYITAFPAANAFDFIDNPTVEAIGEVDIRRVKKSEPHCRAIIQRAKIAHKIVQTYIERGHNFEEVLEEVVTNYKLEKYQ